MKALITGPNGQDGSYLMELLLSKGYEVHGIIRRTSQPLMENIKHLEGKITLHPGDMTDSGSIHNAIEKVMPDEIYNLAGMSQVRWSYDVPSMTMDVNCLGLLRIIESVRALKLDCKIYQACSSEMFGKVQEVPQKETTPFYPRSPYGVSKTAAYNMARVYRESYGMKIYCGILFNHECLTEQTPIIIKKGNFIDIVAIEEVVPHREDPTKGKKFITDGEPDFLVWDGNGWTKVKTRTATWNDESNDKQVHKINVRGGYYEATGDHISFLDKKKQIKTSSLKSGDKVQLMPLPDLGQLSTITKEEAEFLGMMVADGYMAPDGGGRFSKNDKLLRERIKYLYSTLSCGYSKDGESNSGYSDNKVLTVEFSITPFSKTVREKIYNEKGFKKVPKIILNASNEVIKAFIEGYYICDGLKTDRVKAQFVSMTTNSQVLAAGLWLLMKKVYNLDLTSNPEYRGGKTYFHLNVRSNSKKGSHMRKDLNEVKSVDKIIYSGWLFDLETESGTFSAGIGNTWVHNSPRRGEEFLSRKVCKGIAEIIAGKRDKITLGNLDAKRDFGYAKEYVEWIWRIMKYHTPDDFVIATGETHSIKEFVQLAFQHAGIDNWEDYVDYDKSLTRPAEVDLLIGDPSKSKRLLGFEPQIKFNELVKIMVDAELNKVVKYTTI